MTSTRLTPREMFELGREHGRAAALAKHDPRLGDLTVAELLAETAEIIADHDRRRWARAHGLHPANQAAERAELAPVVSIAEPPASHLRIVGDDEGVTPSYTPAEPKSDLQRTIDEADAVMERVRRRRAQLMGLDPDRFATVVSLDERRAGRGCQR